MTYTVANTLLTSTFDYWRNRTNELATAMSTVAVTVQSNAAIGNAEVVGKITSTTISVGNSTPNVVINTTSIAMTNTTANLVLNIPTVNQIANGNYFLSSNSNWIYNPISTYISNSTGISSIKVLDAFTKSQYRIADYVINVSDDNANSFHSTRLFVTHDNDATGAYITEYSTITTNATAGVLGVFSANANTTHVKLNFVPTIANATIKVIRTIV
jgi:hypothetical protein